MMERKEDSILCPACGSSDTYRRKVSPQAFAISVLLIGFPLPFFRRKYHCFNCGMDFKRKDAKEGPEEVK